MLLTLRSFDSGEPTFFDGSASLRLKGKLDDERSFAFWGSPEEGTRNIDALKCQKLPVVIEIDPEDLVPDPFQVSDGGVDVSIPEHATITIIPDL